MSQDANVIRLDGRHQGQGFQRFSQLLNDRLGTKEWIAIRECTSHFSLSSTISSVAQNSDFAGLLPLVPDGTRPPSDEEISIAFFDFLGWLRQNRPAAAAAVAEFERSVELAMDTEIRFVETQQLQTRRVIKGGCGWRVNITLPHSLCIAHPESHDMPMPHNLSGQANPSDSLLSAFASLNLDPLAPLPSDPTPTLALTAGSSPPTTTEENAQTRYWDQIAWRPILLEKAAAFLETSHQGADPSILLTINDLRGWSLSLLSDLIGGLAGVQGKPGEGVVAPFKNAELTEEYETGEATDFIDWSSHTAEISDDSDDEEAEPMRMTGAVQLPSVEAAASRAGFDMNILGTDISPSRALSGAKEYGYGPLDDPGQDLFDPLYSVFPSKYLHDLGSPSSVWTDEDEEG